MSAALLLVALLAQPGFVETRLELGGPVVTFETPDVDDDQVGDVAAVVRERGKRTMLIYLGNDRGGFPTQPSWRWTLPAEVVAYGFFDLRPEPGLELLLLSRRGLYSISPASSKVRGNLRNELKARVFPELADTSDLPRWDWFVDLDGDGAREILLPVDGALVAYRRDDSGLTPTATLPLRESFSTPSRNLRFRVGEGRLGGRVSPLPAMFEGAPSSFPVLDEDRMLDRSRQFEAPWLVDWDGDGRPDIVDAGGGRIGVKRQEPGTRFASVTDWVSEDGDGEIELVNLDHDALLEVVRIVEDGDGLAKDYTVRVYDRDAAGAVAEDASCVLRFNATDVEVEFTDVDNDGIPDLTARLIDLPSTLGALGSLKVSTSMLIHLGDGGCSFPRKPDARFDRDLAPEDLSRLLELLVVDMTGDYDGDGRNDLLTIRPDGLLEIRPIVGDGDGIRFRDEPLSVYLPKKPVESASAAWLSRDDVADLVLRHRESLTLFVSHVGDGR